MPFFTLITCLLALQTPLGQPAPNSPVPIDSTTVVADDWYFANATDEIFLLRGDSLFSSPPKPLRWQIRGRDPQWHGRKIFRVYKAAGRLAVFFTVPNGAPERPPLLWFSGQKTRLLSPASPRVGHRWQLMPEPELPSGKGLFIYLNQDSLDEKNHHICFDSTTIYWLDLHKNTLVRLPFRQKPEYYDESMRYAYFQTGWRVYPEEKQAYPTFHCYDTQSGAITPDVPDLRLSKPWCQFRCDPWDERPCLVERWIRRPSSTGVFDMRFGGIRLANGDFARIALPEVKRWDEALQDSVMEPEQIFQYRVAGQTLYYIAGAGLYRTVLQDAAQPELLYQTPMWFYQFSNGNCLSYSRPESNEEDPYFGLEHGNLFLLKANEKTSQDVLATLRRPAQNPLYQPEEVFECQVVPLAGLQPSQTLFCRIRQGFVAKRSDPNVRNPVVDQYWEALRQLSGAGPRPMESRIQYAFLKEDGRIIPVDLPLLNYLIYYQTLLFHPSGALLVRDWKSGNLRWWGFEVPE